MLDDFDAALTPLRLKGGSLIFRFDAERKELRAETEFRCRRALTEDELALLARETVGAWSDGVGENGFEAEWEGGSGHLYPNPPGYPLGEDRDLRVEQIPK